VLKNKSDMKSGSGKDTRFRPGISPIETLLYGFIIQHVLQDLE